MPTIRLQRRTALTLMTLLAMWLAYHPWRGIWHDNILYAVQALRRLYPGNFLADLYFLHGSQDAFTIFSPLYAAVIRVLGLQGATLALLAAGYVLWAGAAAYLLAASLRGFYFWLGMAMLAGWPSDYGPTPDVFHLAEPFLTPRLFAEGLGILALACLLRGRIAWALLAAGLALALHPLMACAPLLAGLLFLAWGNWRTLGLVAAAGAALLAALTAAGIPPFDRLLMTMDAEWLAMVNQRAPMMAWSAWQAQEWVSRTAVAFCLVATAARLASGPLARLFICAAVLGALGVLTSWVGTGLANNLLLIQAQPWRLLWMTHLCSWLALAWLLGQYWQRERMVRVLLAALCLAVLSRDSVGGALALLAGLALCYLVRRRPLPWPAWGNPLVLACLAGLLVVWSADVNTMAARAATTSLMPSPPTLWQARVASAIKLGAGAAFWWALLAMVWRCGGSRRVAPQLLAFGLAFGALYLAAGFAALKPRMPFALSPGGEQAVLASFEPRIPPGATMYWQNNVLVSWFLLHRSNYASNTQITGLSFNRGTAIEGLRRLARLRRLGADDAVVEQLRLKAPQLPAPSSEALAYVCDDPALDFVVLGTPLPGAIAQAHDAAYNETYYLYACARLRGR